MKCFFYSHSLENPNTRGLGVVSFCIPDLEITFRAKYMGTDMECHYAALLALLEFAEINPGLFKEKILEIYSDNSMMVNQVNLKADCRNELQPLRNIALSYKKRIPYMLGWVAPTENPAFDPMFLD